mgnify:CR=1 FL=1
MTLTIGPHAFEGTAVLAPLASVTSAPFRQICLEHGCSFAVTEMVASEALVRDARKSLRRTERAASERVLVVQLFGADPRVMAQAAALVVERSGASILDVNMGCPVRKILGGGAGVALMRDPERAEAIVREMIRAVDGRVPVTVKMRAGWDDESITAPELARRLEGAGVAAVCVHARTKEQVHSGRSRSEVIRLVREAVRIPVIGNGGIRSAGDAREMMEASGCDAVMVGRGALGNPWIFSSIRDGLDGHPSVEERFAVIRRHFELYVAHSGEATAAREMRKHLCWYLRGLPGSAMVRARLQGLSTSEAVLGALDGFEASLRAGTVVASAADFGAAPEL